MKLFPNGLTSERSTGLSRRELVKYGAARLIRSRYATVLGVGFQIDSVSSISSDAKPFDNFGDWSWLKELEKSGSDLAKQVESDDEYNHCGSLCGTLLLKPFAKRYQNCEGILGSDHRLLKLSAPDRSVPRHQRSARTGRRVSGLAINYSAINRSL
jgi:hypothetical protein